MAKSLRSKWRRKMRNIKRERYGKKELIRLKKMLGLPIDDDTPAANADNVIEFGGDVEMKADTETSTTDNGMSARDMRRIHRMVREGSDCEDSDAEKEIQEIIVMTTSRKIREIHRQKEAKKKRLAEKKSSLNGKDSVDETPAVESAMELDQRRVFNSKTLKDQHGNYPVWMNQKKMRTLAKTNRKLKKKEKKRLAKASGPRPRPIRRDDGDRSEDSELDIDEEEETKEETTIDSVNTTVNTTVGETDMSHETIDID